MGVLSRQIVAAAPDAGERWPFTLNDAELTIATVRGEEEGALESYGREAPFDVVGQSAIRLGIPRDRWGWDGRSHSLWFCDAQEEGEYRWFETAFRFDALAGKSSSAEPFAMEPDEKAGQAFVGAMGVEYALAWPFTPIDQGETEFNERWINWFARAAQGSLGRPSGMPERQPDRSWRKRVKRT